VRFEEAVGIGLMAGVGVFAVFVRKLDSSTKLKKAPSSDPYAWMDVAAGAASALAPHHHCHYFLGKIRRCRNRDRDPKHPEKSVCLYARSTGKLLGRHVDRPSALRQEAAIHARRGR